MNKDFKLLHLPHGQNYIQNRIDNFHREFLSHEHDPETVELLLSTIHDYLLLCDSGESQELAQTIINLRQSIYWLQTWTSEDFED